MPKSRKSLADLNRERNSKTRKANEELVLNILDGNPQGSAHLVTLSGLSKRTISLIVKDLKFKGEVEKTIYNDRIAFKLTELGLQRLNKMTRIFADINNMRNMIYSTQRDNAEKVNFASWPIVLPGSFAEIYFDSQYNTVKDIPKPIYDLPSDIRSSVLNIVSKNKFQSACARIPKGKMIIAFEFDYQKLHAIFGSPMSINGKVIPRCKVSDCEIHHRAEVTE